MEMSGEYRIPAPRETVWRALNDAAILKECIPGCQSLDKPLSAVEREHPPGEEARPEDVVGDVAVSAEAVEERAEVAAGSGFLGGPTMWGLIALAVVIIIIILLR